MDGLIPGSPMPGPDNEMDASNERRSTDLQVLKTPDRTFLFARSYFADRQLRPIAYTSEAKAVKPIANAGKDQTVQPGKTVSLDGGASYDPSLPPSNLEYNWIQLEGPVVKLQNPHRPNPSFLARGETISTKYVFQLVVHNGIAESDPDTVTIHVRPSFHPVPPVSV